MCLGPNRWGKVSVGHHYTPFGLELGYAWMSGSASPSKYRFNGIERAEDFGMKLDMAEFRSYDPAIGRWLQVDPMSEEAPNLNPYRFGFNNPLLWSDQLGLFETKEEAKEYRRNTDGLNWLNSSVNIQSDGSYAIETRTSSTQKVTDGETLEALGVEGGSAIVTSALSRAPSDVQTGSIRYTDKVAPLSTWEQLNGGVVGNAKYNRDGYYIGPAPYASTPMFGPGGPAQAGSMFAKLTKSLTPQKVKQGVKYVTSGKDSVIKLYKSLRQGGWNLQPGSASGGVKTLINPKTGEQIMFRQSRSGGYSGYDSVFQPFSGGGGNATILFK